MAPMDDADSEPRTPTASDIPVIQHSGLFHAGAHPARPFRIVAICLDRTLGDFATTLCFAASVKQLFEHASLAVYFHDDRHYKKTLIEACPQIDTVIAHDGETPLPMEAFDIASGASIRAPYPGLYDGRFHFADLILTQNMMQARYLGSFEQTARFKIPEARVPALAQGLVDAGLDPNRWFCAMHYREPTYDARGSEPFRDVDPKAVQYVSDRIIDDLGGQVVRVGHPAMTPFPPRDGFVDLAPLGDTDFMPQLFAMSRARFTIASASGPHDCSSGLGTPTGVFAAIAPFCVWNAQDAQLLSHILTPDGDRVSVDLALRREMYANILLREYVKRGYQVQTASRDEVFAMAKLLHAQTQDTLGWRTHWYERPVTKTNVLQLPLTEVTRCTNLVFPDLAPGKRVIT